MPRKSLQFASFTLDLERLCLRGPAGEVELRPKSFEVLRYLVEHAGRVASKEEVMAAVWSDVTVTDDSLIRCISEVRHAIGDESKRIVKTVPRRGYLFDAPVLPRHELAEGRASETAQPLQSRKEADPIALSGRPSIVVLPFANLLGNSEEDYLSNGTTEDIITELSRFSELQIIARHSSFRYKGKAVDERQVGRELGVNYVLQGSVRRGNDRVRITAQLMDAESGANLWGERYDRKLDDVFAIQDEVVRTIAPLLVAHVRRLRSTGRY